MSASVSHNLTQRWENHGGSSNSGSCLTFCLSPWSDRLKREPPCRPPVDCLDREESSLNESLDSMGLCSAIVESSCPSFLPFASSSKLLFSFGPFSDLFSPSLAGASFGSEEGMGLCRWMAVVRKVRCDNGRRGPRRRGLVRYVGRIARRSGAYMWFSMKP
jgi:hypothetical protein